MSTRQIIRAIFLSLIVILTTSASAQVMSPRYYDIGSPTLTDIWVDPTNGSDSNSGSSRAQAFRSLTAAWNTVPIGAVTTTGYRILLAAGTNYTGDLLPTYMEGRHGTYSCPIIIQAADGQGTVTLQNSLNLSDCRYLYLIDFNINGADDLIHYENCSYTLVHGMVLRGNTTTCQEVIKMNQCQYAYIEDSEIMYAWNNIIDFVAVQYGHIIGCRLHDAGDWVLYCKGGSAYLRIEGNEIYNGGTGGITAGQGAGFDYMVSPWIHYEANDVKIINNVIHDIEGAGLGANGGYNILMAYNTLYRIGQRSHTIEVVFGLRGFEGNTAVCQAYLAAGGWGTLLTGYENQQPIPDRNVYIYNNIIYNPAGYQSGSSHLAVYAPRTPALNSNIPNPSTTDENLRIRGNIFWNGNSEMPLGIGEADQGGQASNPTCNPAQFLADNAVNSVEPQLIDPAGRDFRPMTNGNVPSATTYSIPAFTGGDRAAPPTEPEGNLQNTIDRDYNGNARASSGPPGAFVVGSVATNNPPSTAPSLVILANGAGGEITVNYPETVSVTVAMNADIYTGVEVDWWVVASANLSDWFYLNSAPQLTPFSGELAALQPVYQGPLFNLASTAVLSGITLPPGTYYFWFAVDYPMDGILNLSGPILYDNVTVFVQ